MDMKPPISRAKMILITKAAIKAIKLYKHVVQIVEKFIKKHGLMDTILSNENGDCWHSEEHCGTAESVCSPPPPVKASSELAQAPTNSMPTVPQLPSSDAFAAVAQLFQTTQGQQLQQILQTFQQPPKPQSPALDNAVMAQVQAITAQLKTAPTQPPEQSAAFPPPEQKTAFDKKLLDRFDYDDEPEAVEDSKKEDATVPAAAPAAAAAPPAPTVATPAVAPAVPVPSATSPPPPQVPFGYPGDGMQQPAYTQHQNMDQFPPRMMGMQQDTVHHQEMEVEQPCIPEVKRHAPESRKSRSRSASRSPKRRRSRSGSRSRRSRHRRSRSRSRDRRRHSPRSRSQERRDREKERERRQKGLPQIKAETASVCSTTLWVGQLDKRTTQQDVASLLEEFGPIESINVSTYSPRSAEQDVPSHF
ncbi:hypothetical protein A6R68_16667 [Neotoma lepida]|uniref:RRM domain-containing protein n=1 Tax=Neotoma lepida TaxID=56216 RepID=A0A1A6HGV9_NEOLE|nr:hypothetical protein A6R68_16667 [Neotoma lepida]